MKKVLNLSITIYISMSFFVATLEFSSVLYNSKKIKRLHKNVQNQNTAIL